MKVPIISFRAWMQIQKLPVPSVYFVQWLNRHQGSGKTTTTTRTATNNDNMTDGWIHLLIAKVFHLHPPRSAAVWNTFPRPSGCQHNVLFASQSRKFCFPPSPQLAVPLVANPFAIRRDNCGAHHAPGTLTSGSANAAALHWKKYKCDKKNINI